MDFSSFFASLKKIYPLDRILTQSAQITPYESDALTSYQVHPKAVVIAESQQEVIDTVRLCHFYEIPFVARGSGTSLSGGSLPVEGGIVIALNRLNKILHLDHKEHIAVVEAGAINLTISRAAAPHNLFYAPDPSSQLVCTIGGNVAFNAGGAHCLKYGMTSNHVLGIKAVLGDGEVLNIGSNSLESVDPDSVGLFVGSEGLFGIALEVTLRLLPKPESVETVLAAYHSLEKAGQAVSRVVASGLLPSAMEIMDSLAIQAAEAAVKAGYPAGAAGLLLVELDGEADAVKTEFVALMNVINQTGAYEIRVAQDEADRQRIWKGRKSAFSAVGRLSPDYLVQDGVVPRSRLGEALAEIERLSAKYNIRVANVFHAGDGNLHPLILIDARHSNVVNQADHLAGDILKMCVKFGGSITGEHGIGIEKRDYLPEMFNRVDISVMQEIRRQMDPKEISNPGKMFPPLNINEAPNQSTEIIPGPIGELQEMVHTHPRLVIRGGGSKTALTPESGVPALDLSGLVGLLEYEPSEYTFTALAGTNITDIERVLAEHGQYLPFDPVFASKGATIGGSVSSGLSGPGRYRYGGVRDFILGIKFIDGKGQLVHSGGKVVKNAAGFDLSKLLVGSLGSLGALVEITCKVFPRPERYASLCAHFKNMTEALNILVQLTNKQLDIFGLELLPKNHGVDLLIRLGGLSESFPPRLDRLLTFTGNGDVFERENEEKLWEDAREFNWVPNGHILFKVPMTLLRIPVFDSAVNRFGALRRYSAGCNLAWLAWDGSIDDLQEILLDQGLSALAIQGNVEHPRLGVRTGYNFIRRVKQALDPEGRWLEV
jgi:glycolate oxidase